MGPIEKRVAKLEQAHSEHVLKKTGCDELMAGAKTSQPCSGERIGTVLELLPCHPSTLPAVRDDYEHAMPYGKGKP